MNNGYWNEDGYWVFGSDLEATDPSSRVSLVIKLNNAAVNDPCRLCGQRTDPECGPELFLEGSWALVCYSCGERHAPELTRFLLDYRKDRALEEFLDEPHIMDHGDEPPDDKPPLHRIK